MKLKISILFLIIAGVFVYFVFKGNYFSLNKKTESSAKQGVLASEDILNKLYASTDLKDYQGNKISIAKGALDDHRAVIIHLWASWCGPCVNEVPELIEYSKKNPDVKFVIISMDEFQEEVAKFLKSFPEFNSDNYIKILDGPNSLSKFLNADRLPMSIIIRKDKDEPQIVKSVVRWKSLEL